MTSRASVAIAAIASALIVLGVPARASALGARLVDVRVATRTVKATFELADAFPQKFQTLIESGGTLHLRVQVEVWERRTLWDRIVRPAITTVFRMAREPATGLLRLVDQYGAVTTFPGFVDRLPVLVDVISADSIDDDRTYYLHAVAAVGTVADREIDGVTEAVFGEDQSTLGLGSLGRLMFRKVLQFADYLDSVSCQVDGPKVKGREMKRAP